MEKPAKRIGSLSVRASTFLIENGINTMTDLRWYMERHGEPAIRKIAKGRKTGDEIVAAAMKAKTTLSVPMFVWKAVDWLDVMGYVVCEKQGPESKIRISHYIKASKQILDDFKALQPYIDGRLRYGIKLGEEKTEAGPPPQ